MSAKTMEEVANMLLMGCMFAVLTYFTFTYSLVFTICIGLLAMGFKVVYYLAEANVERKKKEKERRRKR